MNELIYCHVSPVYFKSIHTQISCSNKVYIKRTPLRRFTFVAWHNPVTHNVYLGVSICHPNDVFDKHYGKIIAQINAQKNPFFTIPNYTGIRKDYYTLIKQQCKEKEKELLKHFYPMYYK